MLISSTDAPNALYTSIAADSSALLLSSTPNSSFFDDAHSFYSSADDISSTLFNGSSFDDILCNNYSNTGCLPGPSRFVHTNTPDNNTLRENSFNFNDSIINFSGLSTEASGYGSLHSNSMEMHKPLFGVHPQVIPFSPSSSIQSQTLIEFPLQTSSHFAAAPLISTPSPLQFHHITQNATTPVLANSPSPSETLDSSKCNWIKINGYWQVQCSECFRFIKTNCRKQNLTTLRAHKAGKKCVPDETPQELEMNAARDMRRVLFPWSLSEKENVNVIPNRIAIGVADPTPASKSRIDSSIQPLDVLVAQSDNENELESGLRARASTSKPTNNICRPSLDQLVTKSMDNVYECPGIDLNWPLDYFWQSYPFARLDRTGAMLGFRFAYLDPLGLNSRIRSESCLEDQFNSLFEGDSCHECRKLTKVREHVALKAEHAEPCTNYYFLSSRQIVGVTRGKDQIIQTQKLAMLSLSRKYATLLAHHDDAKRFLMAVSTNDTPRLHQLVKQCIKDKASIKQIVAKIEDSVAKVYHVRGYEQCDLDIALLCYRLGGRALLHAMSQQSSVPTLRTLLRKQAFTSIMPSHCTPTIQELTYNLNQVLGPHRAKLDVNRPFRSGISIFWDEINIEEVACYFPHSDSVGGLCREHSSMIDTRLHSMQSAYSIAKGLLDGTVHYGKEASVIAIGSFGSVIQGALPIAISPTCKKESPSESAAIARCVIAAYQDAFKELFGPIWTFASDGDAGRRSMAQMLFMSQTVDRNHVLFKYVGRLLGLNKFVGEYDITADIDWKHLLKRAARLSRCTEGTIVGNTIVNREVLIRHLGRIPGLTDYKIHLLMNPADGQDVPRAMELLSAIGQISTLSNEDCSPSEVQEAQIIHVIGELFCAFQNAFTNVQWTLDEQLTSLSKYAHMAFVLFRKNRVNFMPNQLYIDSQICVKNVFFCVAKQQNMDRTQDFHLFLLGDDRLENLFGRIRMQGGHNPNCTFKQLVDRAGAAVDITNVFTRNPSLDQGHRRLKMNRSHHFDHLNKKSWQGSQSVQHIDLEDAWSRGREAALSTLEKINCSEDVVKLLQSSAVTDLMRPFGDGHYPGISDDSAADRSSLQDESTSAGSSTTCIDSILENSALTLEDPQMNDPTAEDSATIDPHYNVYAFDDDDMTNFSSNLDKATARMTNIDQDYDEQAGLELEDVLDEPAELMLPETFDTRNSDVSPFVQQEPPGKPIHKASICRLIINPDWARKSHERILRVRGYTSERKFVNLNTENLIDTEAFIVGDLYASLIRSDGVLSLALMKCIAIEEKDKRVERVNACSFGFAASRIFLFGQILEMYMVQAEREDLEIPQMDSAESEDSRWIWTGSYAKLDVNSRVALKGKGDRKTLVVKTLSQSCKPINPHVIHINDIALSTEFEALQALGESKMTWVVNQSALLLVVEYLWQKVKNEKLLGSLPKFTANASFPYKNKNGHAELITLEGSALLNTEKADKTDKYRCYQCHQYMDLGQARNHVGQHILRSMRNVPESLSGDSITGDSPCGFCGQSGLALCQQVHLTKGSKPQAKSACPHFFKFKYQMALISTISTPCTNVPIICTMPSCTKLTTEGLSAIWKYNMAAHIRTEHPGYSTDLQLGAAIPDSVLSSMFISDEEEHRLKIPKEKIPFKIPPKANLSESVPGGGSKGTKRRNNPNANEEPSISKRRK